MPLFLDETTIERGERVMTHTVITHDALDITVRETRHASRPRFVSVENLPMEHGVAVLPEGVCLAAAPLRKRLSSFLLRHKA